MQLSEDAITERLERWPIARLASRARDGRLHQVPIVFARSGGRLWSPVDGKPKRGAELTRVLNLRAHPEVSLLIDEYSSDWRQLWWIRIEATAEVLQPASTDELEVSAALEALEAKYPQYASVPVLRAPPTLIAFEPGRTVSWTASARMGTAKSTAS
jgi:PPOX class probable F420-dependent enzyme